MGLLSFLKKLSRPEKELRFLVLGLDNAGKTTILRLLNDEDIIDVTPTTGVNIKSIQTNFGFRINAWDIGGQKRIRQFWRSQYDNTDTLIYVVDSADKARLKESVTEFRILVDEKALADVPILVYANKQDLPDKMDAEEIANSLGMFQLGERMWRVQPCSTSTGEGLLEGIEWACKAMNKDALVS